MEHETTDENVVPHTRWLKQEENRRTEIRQVYSMHGDAYTELMDRCLDDPHMSVDKAKDHLLRQLGEDSPGPLTGDFRQDIPSVSMARDNNRGLGYGNYQARDTLGEFTQAVTDSLLQRGGIQVVKPHPGARDCQNMRMSDIAETMLRQLGTRTSGMSRDQVIRKALTTRGAWRRQPRYSGCVTITRWR